MPKLIDEQRLIDARSLMRVIMNHEISMSVCMTQDEQCGMARMRRMVIEDIHAAPTIEPEVRHGRWKKKNGEIYCTNCKKSKWSESFKLMLQGFDFCPNCGAKMDDHIADVSKKVGAYNV